MKGTVKFYNEEKGYGFIKQNGAVDIFVHASGITSGEAIKENDTVIYDIEQGDRGEKAVNVAVITE